MRDFTQAYGGALALGLLLLANIAITPNFAQSGTLNNFLLQVYPTLMVALGMTLVIATGGIDISVGAIMALGASVTAKVYIGAEAGLLVALGAGMLTAAVCGLFNGLLVAKFGIQPIIVTLILMIGGRGLAQIVLGELYLSTYGTEISTLGSYTLGPVPIQLVLMAVACSALYFVVNRTMYGRRIEALGDNPKAARLVGIRTPLYLMGVYVACGLFSGLAGILEGARINAINAGNLGLLVELDAIAAVAIGGTVFEGGKPKVMGTVIGASIVQVITMMVNMNDITFHYSLVVKAAIVVLALYFQRGRQS